MLAELKSKKERKGKESFHEESIFIKYDGLLNHRNPIVISLVYSIKCL